MNPTIKTSKCEMMIVKLPDDATEVQCTYIKHRDYTTIHRKESPIGIFGQSGKWHLIPDIFNPSEEDAKMVVDRINDYFTRNHASRYRNYADYDGESDDTYFETATASFATLIEKEGYSRVNGSYCAIIKIIK